MYSRFTSLLVLSFLWYCSGWTTQQRSTASGVESSFKDWARENGVLFPNVLIESLPSKGRCLIAGVDCAESEELLRIPLEICFIERKDGDTSSTSWPIGIALQLMDEAGCTKGSPYLPYFDILPPKLPFLPYKWQQQGISLHCLDSISPDFSSLVDEQIDWRAEAYEIVQAMRPDVDLQLLGYYLDIVQTRNCQLDNVNAVVPFLDLLNHVHPNEANAEFHLSVSHDQVIVSAKKSIVKGEEIVITYGPLKAYETLLAYGFVPLQSDYDEVKVALGMSIYGPMVQEQFESRSSALSLCQRLGISPFTDNGFVFYRNGLGSILLTAARLLVMTNEEREALCNDLDSRRTDDGQQLPIFEANVYKRPVSLDNEKMAVALLLNLLDNLMNKVQGAVGDDTGDEVMGDEDDVMGEYGLYVSRAISLLQDSHTSVLQDCRAWIVSYLHSL